MKKLVLFLACLTLSCSSPSVCGIKCPVVADNYICADRREQESNLGGKTFLRLKGIEDTAVLKFDMTHLKGMTVESATLYLHKKKHDLLSVGISTIASDWVEGHGKRYAQRHEASCFQYAAYKNAPWSYPGSDFTDVIFGQGNSLFSYVKPELVDGWYVIDIPPNIIHALITGDQYGLAVSDEKGQIPVEKSVDSKESIFAPFLVVKAKKIDILPPSSVSALTANAVNGKIQLTWKPTGDDGIGGKVFGYSVRYSSLPIVWDSACPVKRWEIPRKPEKGRENIELMIDGLIPCQKYYFAVQAYDEAGNVSAIVYTDIIMPEKEPEMELLNVELPQPENVPFVPVFGNGAASIWAVSDLEKVNPVTGNTLEDKEYAMPTVDTARLSNSIWDAGQKVVTIYGARNETVAFQVIIEATEKMLNNVVVQADTLSGSMGLIQAEKNIELFRLWYVPVKGVYYPDACVPLKGKFNVPDSNNKIPGQKNQAVWVDIYIPKETPAGVYEGVLSISSDEIKKPVEIGINLTVWDFSLPDTPSFVNELNAYGGIHKGMGIKRGSQEYKKIELGYHQLARKHRSTVNVLPYGEGGSIGSSDYVPLVGAGSKPAFTGAGLEPAPTIDWADWDNRFGLYLDGTAFTEGYGYYGPGTGTPITHFYLPFNENWPTLMMESYGVKIQERGYPACVYEHARYAPSIERAFSKGYKELFVSMASEYARHFQEKGWNATRFQFYLNNKYYARENGKGTAWWLLDEPAHRDDFLALAFFGQLFWEGVGAGSKPAPACPEFDFRVDISRPQYQRGLLDGLASLQDVSYKAFVTKSRLCMERKQRFGETYWFYGGGPQIEETSASLMGLYYQAYLLGADGGLPYYTSFCHPDCWSKGEYLAIVYPGSFGPIAGLRLKVERRAVQDIEYLTLLAAKEGWSRDKINQAVLKKIRLKGDISSRDTDDPGRITFSHLKSDDFNRLRIAMANTMMLWE